MNYKNPFVKSAPVGFATPTRQGISRMPLAKPVPERMVQPVTGSSAIQTKGQLLENSYLDHDLAIQLNWRVAENKTDGSTANVALRAAITAGRHSGYTVLGESTRTYGDTQEVDITAFYGEGGVKRLADFQALLKERPVVIGKMRFIYQPQAPNAGAQLASNFILTQVNDFKDNDVRTLSPQLLVSPSQFQLGILEFDVNFKLDKDTILEYTVQPGQDVNIILFPEAVLNTNNLI
ncbi:MAG: hypothetical protein AAFW00_19785 [Bacteroidota bacterium]